MVLLCAGACGASISCSVLSRRHLPVAGTGSPLLTRAAPHGTQPCPDPNGVLCIWDALLPSLGPCRRGREHRWGEAGDGGRGQGTPRCVGRAQCHVDGIWVPMGLPHSGLSLGTGHPRMSHAPQPLGGVAGDEALTSWDNWLRTKPLLCAWGRSPGCSPIPGQGTGAGPAEDGTDVCCERCAWQVRAPKNVLPLNANFVHKS